LPLKRWLGLGLLVLLAHLGLLQSLPVGLNPASTQPGPTLRFSTRAIAPLPDAAALQSARVAVPPRKSPTAKAVAAKDVPLPAVGDAQGQQTVAAAAQPWLATPDAQSSASRSGMAHDEAGEQHAAPAPAPATSEPVIAEAFETPPLPEPPPQRHPRARPPSFQAASLAGSVRLHYKVSANKFPFSLVGELLWHNLGDHYDARLSYSAFGLSRSQSSRGRVAAGGLAPDRFADKYRSEVAAHFNYADGKVTFSANTPDAPLLAGAQDRLSVLLQLGALVATEPERYTPGTTLTLPTVGARDADLWLFTFESVETLVLPGGTLQAHKLVRLPRKPYDQTVEVWLAAQLGYLPARIRITEANGDAIDQQWQASDPAPGAE